MYLCMLLNNLSCAVIFYSDNAATVLQDKDIDLNLLYKT